MTQEYVLFTQNKGDSTNDTLPTYVVVAAVVVWASLACANSGKYNALRDGCYGKIFGFD